MKNPIESESSFQKEEEEEKKKRESREKKVESLRAHLKYHSRTEESVVGGMVGAEVVPTAGGFAVVPGQVCTDADDAPQSHDGSLNAHWNVVGVAHAVTAPNVAIFGPVMYCAPPPPNAGMMRQKRIKPVRTNISRTNGIRCDRRVTLS